MSYSEFRVQRLQLWHFARGLREDVPKGKTELEKYLTQFFFRYFGLFPQAIKADEYDLESFKRHIENFRKLINEWRVKCKGFSEKFLEKPFFSEDLVLKKIEEVREEPREEVREVSAEEDNVVEDQVRPFCDLAPSTQRAKSADLRNNSDPDLLCKAVCQNFESSGNHAAGYTLKRLHDNPSELGKSQCFFNLRLN